MGSIKHTPGHPCCDGGPVGVFTSCCQMTDAWVAEDGPLFFVPGDWVTQDCPDESSPILGDLLVRFPGAINTGPAGGGFDWVCSPVCSALAGGLVLQHVPIGSPHPSGDVGAVVIRCTWSADFEAGPCYQTPGGSSAGTYLRAIVEAWYDPLSTPLRSKPLSGVVFFRDMFGPPFSVSPPESRPFPFQADARWVIRGGVSAPDVIDLDGGITAETLLSGPTPNSIFRGCKGPDDLPPCEIRAV